MKTERTIKLNGQDEVIRWCGPYDRYLRVIREAFRVAAFLRGTALVIKGRREDIQKASEALQRINKRVNECGVDLSAEELERLISNKPRTSVATASYTRFLDNLKPRSEGQRRYIEAMEQNDIVFSIGPAGTGKTYLAVARALQCLRQDLVKKIILTRPAVEAGERLGFLPGSYQEKVNPYLRPLYDALQHFLSYQQLHRLIETEIVEVIPLAYMRGRNLDAAFMILDEGQNTTSEQMKMFLTRMGEGSKIVVTGDISQIDLPTGKTSGLVEVQGILSHLKGIVFSYLTRADIVRHPLVQSIVDAYEIKRSPAKKSR